MNSIHQEFKETKKQLERKKLELSKFDPNEVSSSKSTIQSEIQILEQKLAELEFLQNTTYTTISSSNSNASSVATRKRKAEQQQTKRSNLIESAMQIVMNQGDLNLQEFRNLQAVSKGFNQLDYPNITSSNIVASKLFVEESPNYYSDDSTTDSDDEESESDDDDFSSTSSSSTSSVSNLTTLPKGKSFDEAILIRTIFYKDSSSKNVSVNNNAPLRYCLLKNYKLCARKIVLDPSFTPTENVIKYLIRKYKYTSIGQHSKVVDYETLYFFLLKIGNENSLISFLKEDYETERKEWRTENFTEYLEEVFLIPFIRKYLREQDEIIKSNPYYNLCLKQILIYLKPHFSEKTKRELLQNVVFYIPDGKDSEIYIPLIQGILQVFRESIISGEKEIDNEFYVTGALVPAVEENYVPLVKFFLKSNRVDESFIDWAIKNIRKNKNFRFGDKIEMKEVLQQYKREKFGKTEESDDSNSDSDI